jgi:hypothetical protein
VRDLKTFLVGGGTLLALHYESRENLLAADVDRSQHADKLQRLGVPQDIPLDELRF